VTVDRTRERVGVARVGERSSGLGRIGGPNGTASSPEMRTSIAFEGYRANPPGCVVPSRWRRPKALRVAEGARLTTRQRCSSDNAGRHSRSVFCAATQHETTIAAQESTAQTSRRGSTVVCFCGRTKGLALEATACARSRDPRRTQASEGTITAGLTEGQSYSEAAKELHASPGRVTKVAQDLNVSHLDRGPQLPSQRRRSH
jgi:hypothetical protein